MLTDDELRNFDIFLKKVRETVRDYPVEFRHCSLQAVTTSADTRYCLVRAGVANGETDELFRYPNCQLLRETFPVSDLPSRLEKFNATGRLPSKFGDVAFERTNNFPQQNFHASHSEYHSWPGHLYQMADGLRNYAQPQPLVGMGLPPFFNVVDVVRNWIGVKSAGDSDGRNGRLLLFLPTFSARLEQLTFSDEMLMVKSSSQECTFWISVLATDGRTTVRETQKLAASHQFQLMENPTSLQVFITNEHGDIVDTFSEEERWSSRERVIYAGAYFSRETMDTIRRGETDTVEFKEFIRLEDKKKTADIVKAVISLANTAGGTLFIGVTDDAEIVGVDRNAPNDRQKASTFESDYFTGIRKLLQEKLNRIPTIEYRSEKIGDKTVFVVRIHEGAAKPYFNVQTNECFIRRGASDVRPDPDSELRQMFGAANISALEPFGWNR
jgi:hypothetical protein